MIDPRWPRALWLLTLQWLNALALAFQMLARLRCTCP